VNNSVCGNKLMKNISFKLNNFTIKKIGKKTDIIAEITRRR
jgi:hypothetical protein